MFVVSPQATLRKSFFLYVTLQAGISTERGRTLLPRQDAQLLDSSPLVQVSKSSRHLVVSPLEAEAHHHPRRSMRSGHGRGRYRNFPADVRLAHFRLFAPWRGSDLLQKSQISPDRLQPSPGGTPGLISASGEHGPVDFYTQHQSCPEEITLKEVSGATYHDESFLDAGQAQDFFGDEDSGLDRCLDFLTSVEVRGWDSEDPERTCRPDASLFPEAVLDGAPKGVDGGDVAKGRPPSPVPFLPLVPDAPGAKKRGRRKCKVTTDLVTTLSDEAMRLQLGDDSDLVVEPPPLGPARRKRTTSALELLTRPCSRFLPTEILEDFPKDAVPPRTEKTWRGHPRAGDGGLESLWDGSPDLPRSDDWRHLEEPWRSLANGADSVAESSPCGPESGAESSMENEAYLPLLEFLQLGGEAELEALPLSALWSGRGREEVAPTFLSLLVLCHRGAVFASQSAPYRDIFATPRPAFFTRPQQ
ncbi:uncharacterized protein LOC144087157 isoform X3 [Stigmatopora argus]